MDKTILSQVVMCNRYKKLVLYTNHPDDSTMQILQNVKLFSNAANMLVSSNSGHFFFSHLQYLQEWQLRNCLQGEGKSLSNMQ